MGLNRKYCVNFVLLLFFRLVLEANCDCTLNLQKDFGNPSPVYLQNGDFLAPNSKGQVIIRRQTEITVGCPGDRRYVVLGNSSTSDQVVEARCVSNTTFKVGKWRGQFKDIHCNVQPWFSTEEAGKCYGGNKLYRVGYKVQGKFYSIYQLCFDNNLLTTVYAIHSLTPTSRLNQGGGRRPQFIEGDLFGKVRMSELYKTKNQKARLNDILGDGMGEEYITKNQFLNRGHLTPRGDLTMSALQRATFHYANTAPQWMRSNAGDWAALEDALRRRSEKLNTTLTIYTGTFGVLRLSDSRDKDAEVYLASDANNNQIVPVPLYFFKIAQDPVKRTATAFITINSSFYNSTVTDKLTFCSDICDGNKNYSWLRWRADGAHSFCCTYEDFSNYINVLPKLDVVGEFY